jgi:ABC-type uncharacterized transport system substrate-binding protein
LPYWSGPAKRAALRLALVGVALTGFAASVEAHPHVWATVRSEVVIGPQNEITAIKHAWTFDEFYSAMAVQGLDSNGDGTYAKDELEPLAKVNVESLKDFDYFTFVRREGENAFLPLKGPEDYWVEYDGTALTLHFTLPLEAPLAPRSEGVTLDVYDPSFFVAFGFAEKDPVKIAGSAPGCAAKVAAPDPEAAEDAKALTESFFSQLGPDSNYGSQFAQTATVTCGAQ